MFVSAVALAFAWIGGHPLSVQEPAEWSRLLDASAYTLSQAIDKGLREAGEGVPFHAELERDKGTVVFSIDVAQGSRTCNVVLDAKSGTVLEKELEDEDHAAEVGACRIGLKAAIDAAVDKNPGRPVEAELVLVQGRPAIRVKVLDGGKLASVDIDAAMGEAAAAQPGPAPAEPAYTDVFRVEAEEWTSTGANPYFILEPGWFLVLEGKDGDKDARLTITVLDETRRIAGVETRVVEEREEAGGRLVEISRNYFAMSRRTGSVYYFGEDVDIYKDGTVVKHEGAWLAGENGARFGLIMPGTPLLGARYYQEIAPGVAMDRAEIVGLAETLETPAGSFEGVLKIRESTPLERGTEHKYHAWGVGLVREEDLKLTRYGRAGG
ncbi:MAG: hypothetical protein EYC70_01460 [Planctomycetota bacterium]|nr:MAG: hypothetical protein EYC70_01460 [Planctomycetota bacterium]